MIVVKQPNHSYSLSYRELKEDFERYEAMSDTEFVNNIKEILHFACICSWFKELGIDTIVSDEGIIHELVHLLTNTHSEVGRVRSQFNNLLRLV